VSSAETGAGKESAALQADGPGEALARTSEREGMGISGTGSVGLSAPSGARRPTGMRSTEGLGADGAAERALEAVTRPGPAGGVPGRESTQRAYEESLRDRKPQRHYL